MCVTVSAREAFLASLFALVEEASKSRPKIEIMEKDLIRICDSVYKNDGFLIGTSGMLKCAEVYGYKWASVDNNRVTIESDNYNQLAVHVRGSVSGVILKSFLNAVTRG